MPTGILLAFLAEVEELDGVLDYPRMLWYICKLLKRIVVAGVVYNASLYGLGVEVCKAASSPCPDPKGNILLLSPLLSYI